MKILLIVTFSILAFAPVFGQEKATQDTTITTPVKAKFIIDSVKVFIHYVNISGHVMADSLWEVRSGYASMELERWLKITNVKHYRMSGNEFDETLWILEMWTGTRTPMRKP